MIIGLDAPDDAALWRLDDTRALVVTADFFTPVVDDPYDYGAIAAANSLSDIYAMGAKPFLALVVAALPPNLPLDVSQQIMRGLAEKTQEAGAVIAGGHTIQDKEPKVGLVALGMVDTDKIFYKGGLKAGDQLILTKPLGFGVTTTALKADQVTPAEAAEVVTWMKRLNRDAAELAQMYAVHGATDITGYSLLGHAWEMAQGSGVGLLLDFAAMPFVQAAERLANLWLFPGGASNNRLHFEQYVDFGAHISEAQRMLLFDPQTSGGLLLVLEKNKAAAFLHEAERRHVPAWRIGEVVAGDKIRVV